jgi:hypothetical protein
LVRTKSLSCVGPLERSARRRLPSRGSLRPRFPTFRGTMRRDDCPRALLGSLRLSRASRYLACFSRSWSPRRARCLVEAPRQRQGFWSPGPPCRACRQGDRGLSHVPAFPLGSHAPLSDPGGVLRTRPRARRTAAFQRLHTVGFPLRTTWRDSLLSTTLHSSGLNDAAGLLAPPGSVRPLTGRHAGSLLTCWLDFHQVGLALCAHPLGNINQFHGFSPNSKVSGLPWREQANVRRWCGQGRPTRPIVLRSYKSPQ